MTTKAQEPSIVTAKDVVGVTTAVGAATAQALIVSPTAAPTVIALAAVLVTLFPPVIAAMTEAGVRRMKARADRFYGAIVEKWAKDAGITPSEIAGQLEALQEDPNAADAMWRAVRGLMEAPNDAAAIPLGTLAAEYLRDKLPADAFFRGTVRLLTELSTQETDELAGIIDWVLAKTSRPSVRLIARDQENTSKGKHGTTVWKQIPWTLEIRRDDPNDADSPDRSRDESADIRYEAHPGDAERLLFLLKSNGLARDSGATFFGATPPNVDLDRPIVARLAGVFRTRK